MTNNSTFEKKIFILADNIQHSTLTEKMILLDYKTKQHAENNSTCILQYHYVTSERSIYNPRLWSHIEECMVNYFSKCKLIRFGSALMPYLKRGNNGEGGSPSILPYIIPECSKCRENPM